MARTIRACPLSEAEQIVNKLRAKGGEVWYLLAADEGHGYRKKQNRDAYYETFAQFLMMLQQLTRKLGRLGAAALLFAFGGRRRQGDF